jgi:hypothetical protein
MAARSVRAQKKRPANMPLYGSALDHYEKRYLESAAAEAQRPTNIPDGELRQVTSYDAAGRPSYTYFGKCSTWLSDFAAPKKKLLHKFLDAEWMFALL